jgi:hypothetical protein
MSSTFRRRSTSRKEQEEPQENDELQKRCDEPYAEEEVGSI